jgi:hypothetical protein
MRHTTKLGIALSVLVVGSAGLGFPAYVRSQVRQKLPSGVQVTGHIDVGLTGVMLHGVKIDRDWIRGTLDTVWISRDQKTVTTLGGDLDIDLDKRAKEATKGSDKRLITGKGLRVVVTRGSASASLQGASWDGFRVYFDSGDFSFPHGTRMLKLHATDGRYEASGEASAKSVSGHLDQLPNIPGLTLTETDVFVEDVRLTQTEAAFQIWGEKFTAGPFSGAAVVFTQKKKDGTREAEAQSFTLKHPWLDSSPITFTKVGIRLEAPYTKGFLWGDSIEVKFDLSTRMIEGKNSCQAWLNSMPESLKSGPLKALTFTGALGFSVAMEPKPTLTLDARCKAKCEMFPHLREKFSYTAYKADGAAFERTTGPKTSGWMPIALMGRLPLAVVNYEDFAFPWHKGYLTEAFQNSLTDNVAKDSFARGGSTITQQTAKNLWLKREKTIGRKIAELFLAQALESCMSKDEILETYLNIIEFGPNVYGIDAGARYWFEKASMDLSSTEVFWLASILPAPRKATRPTMADLKRTEKLMRALATRGRIPDLAEDGSATMDTSEWEQNTP